MCACNNRYKIHKTIERTKKNIFCKEAEGCFLWIWGNYRKTKYKIIYKILDLEQMLDMFVCSLFNLHIIIFSNYLS